MYIRVEKRLRIIYECRNEELKARFWKDISQILFLAKEKFVLAGVPRFRRTLVQSRFHATHSKKNLSIYLPEKA